MKLLFEFSNILGAVYRKGDLLFTPDSNSILSPIGNRICVYDLKNNSAKTLPVESKYNFESLALSPSGTVLIATNEEGEASIISLISCRKIFSHRFNDKICCTQFSPDGNYVAFCKINKVFVFKAPGRMSPGYSNHFELVKVLSGFYNDTVCLDWSMDSRILAIGTKDGIVKLFPIEFLKKFHPCTLTGHTDSLVGVFFEHSSLNINTISRNGQLCIWECTLELDDLKETVFPLKKKKLDSDEEDNIQEEEEEKEQGLVKTEPGAGETILRYEKLGKHYLNDANKYEKGCHLTAACYQRKSRLIITGFSNGAFFIHELPQVTLVHSLSVCQNPITCLAINATADWMALGCQEQSQLLVWEWQSETYILKQQAHSSPVSTLAYSPDGACLVTGAHDGKVKLWNTGTGFCFVTFKEHSCGISAVKFASNGKFVLSASVDGTIRAFDTIRYRNFRTFTSPKPVQFSCVAMDAANEFVAAGAQDVFEIYLWSVKIGHLLENLSSHEGPVVSLAFSPIPSSTTLVSVSWDKSMRIWNTVEAGTEHETVQLSAEGLCVAFKPDGKEVAICSLDGQISFFESLGGRQISSIEGRNDLGSGRTQTDFITSERNLQAKAFDAICYSADGTCVIAAGRSKNVCIYSVAAGILLKKFQITQNHSLDALEDYMNYRKMTEFGNLDLVEKREEGEVKIRLPGAQKGDMASRSVKPEVRVFDIAWSPTGLSWSAATVEGVLMYSLNSGILFDPFNLDPSVTTGAATEALKQKQYFKALMMGLKLNEKPLLEEIVQCIPPGEIELLAQSLPAVYTEKMLQFVAGCMDKSVHIEFYTLWIYHALNSFSTVTEPTPSRIILLGLQQRLRAKYEQLSRICDENKFIVNFVEQMASKKVKNKGETSTLCENGETNDSGVAEITEIAKKVAVKGE